MPSGEETKAIFAKSVALLEKTRAAIAQIDSTKFPTPSSEDARKLVATALEHLVEPGTLASVSPEVLYNRLINLQEYVTNLEQSMSDRISWPLVSYCDEIRKIFFADGSVTIFYSLTGEHNYSIEHFSSNLRSLLKDLFTTAQLDAIFGGPQLFRLSLASLEDDNLPLYANIGHEFGHALFSVRKSELAGMMVPHFSDVLKAAEVEWGAIEANSRKEMLGKLMRYLFLGPGEELYCDLIGSLLMGPAFFLSLYEMYWGAKKETWTGRLAQDSGYPSLNFRLSLIKEWIQLDSFTKEAAKDFSKLTTESLRDMPGFLSSISTDHSNDNIRLTGDNAPEYKSFIRGHWSEIKNAYSSFLSTCRERIVDEYKGRLPDFSSPHVAELLRRLEADILPNIIPDRTIYGAPASFQAILNAAAIARAATLAKATDTSTIREDMQKIERLTSKALEVSYIQMKFKNR